MTSHRLALVLLSASAVSAAGGQAWAAEADRGASVSPATTASDGYKLVWSDEFERDGPPNPQSWEFERGFVCNQELQWYQPETRSAAENFSSLKHDGSDGRIRVLPPAAIAGRLTASSSTTRPQA